MKIAEIFTYIALILFLILVFFCMFYAIRPYPAQHLAESESQAMEKAAMDFVGEDGWCEVRDVWISRDGLDTRIVRCSLANNKGERRFWVIYIGPEDGLPTQFIHYKPVVRWYGKMPYYSLINWEKEK